MPSKNTEKNSDSIKELQRNISPILVINNPTLKPYIELFEYVPENVYQKPLGNLIGFFEIKEYSEDSAYVVNFLTSVLKKEYYANPKRPVTESFDSALHKVNLALSEIAKHGNVQWIGKLHAAICVIEKNSIHFTVSGNGKIFLSRKEIFTDISEDLSSEEEEPHPLKTFVNVSSGRIEKEDRLIITSEDIFHILKLTDIRKNLQRLTKEQFVQFLKTALSNELEMIATIVTEFEDSKKVATIKNSKKEVKLEALNVFSETSFKGQNVIENIGEISSADEEQTKSDYTNKQTGHIYVQGEALPGEISSFQYHLESATEKISDYWHFSKNTLRRKYILYKKQIEKKLQQRRIQAEHRKQLLAQEKEALEKQRLEDLANEKLAMTEQVQVENIEKITPQAPPAKKQLSKVINLRQKIELARQSMNIQIEEQPLPKKTKAKQVDEHITINEISQPQSNKRQLVTDLFNKSKEVATEKLGILVLQCKKINFDSIGSKTKQITPHFSKIQSLYHRLSPKQRYGVLLSMVIIFIIPIFISSWMNKPKPATIQELPKTETAPVEKFADKTNKIINSQSKNILSKSGILSSIIANDKIIALTKKSLIVIDNGSQNEFTLPENTGNAISETYMKDLSMILILTDQSKVISFTPSNLKFTENKIDFAGLSTSSFMGTYLTYLYVLDPNTSQISRFPRAEGGFGAATNWLKDPALLSNSSGMTIDDNIYVLRNNKISKFFKGKEATFSVAASDIPLKFDFIYTTVDSQFIYAIDKQNSRMIKLSKTGEISAQYLNDELKNSNSLSVNESKNEAYVATPSGMVAISM